MSTLSSANVTDVNLVLKERTHMRLCLNMLIFTHNLGNWLTTKTTLNKHEVHEISPIIIFKQKCPFISNSVNYGEHTMQMVWQCYWLFQSWGESPRRENSFRCQVCSCHVGTLSSTPWSRSSQLSTVHQCFQARDTIVLRQRSTDWDVRQFLSRLWHICSSQRWAQSKFFLTLRLSNHTHL